MLEKPFNILVARPIFLSILTCNQSLARYLIQTSIFGKVLNIKFLSVPKQKNFRSPIEERCCRRKEEQANGDENNRQGGERRPGQWYINRPIQECGCILVRVWVERLKPEASYLKP